MAQQAHITSIEILELLRSSLIVYASKARLTLDEVTDDVARTRVWLQSEQRTLWESQLRRRNRSLEDAQQAYFSARLSNLREATTAELMAVQKAKRAVTEAEEKLKVIKKWNLEFDSRVEPLAKQLDQLRDVLAISLPQAVADLTEMIKALSEYASLAVPGAAAAPAEAAPESAPPDAPAAGGPAA